MRFSQQLWEGDIFLLLQTKKQTKRNETIFFPKIFSWKAEEHGGEHRFFWDPHRLDWREDLVQSSGDAHWLEGQAVAESAGRTPEHSFLPSKPQVADTVTSLARNPWRHPSQNHSFAPIKQSSPSRMPRKSITTKLPIRFDSLTTCRHDHNVWSSFFIIIILRSAATRAWTNHGHVWIFPETNFSVRNGLFSPWVIPDFS